MSVGQIVVLMRGAVMHVFMLCAPVLAISIFQTVTSIQEQTLTFLPKMLVILGLLALLGGWMLAMLRGYTFNLFSMIPNLAR